MYCSFLKQEQIQGVHQIMPIKLQIWKLATANIQLKMSQHSNIYWFFSKTFLEYGNSIHQKETQNSPYSHFWYDIMRLVQCKEMTWNPVWISILCGAHIKSEIWHSNSDRLVSLWVSAACDAYCIEVIQQRKQFSCCTRKYFPLKPFVWCILIVCL